MRHHLLALLVVLNTSNIIQHSVVCSTASATSPLLFWDYGDTDDFMKLIQRYQTPPQFLFPSKKYDQERMDEVLQNMEFSVCLAVIYLDKRDEMYKNKNHKYKNPDENLIIICFLEPCTRRCWREKQSRPGLKPPRITLLWAIPKSER